MIPAGGRFDAIYSASRKIVTKPVVAWSDEGHAMVLDTFEGKLVRADQLKNFDSVREEKPGPASMIPGGGWMYEFTDEDGITERVQPVVAWVVSDEGNIVPCNLADDGIYASELGGDGFRVYHPDATGQHGPRPDPS